MMSSGLVADESRRSQPSIQRVTMDVYIRKDSERCRDLCDFLKSMTKRRSGLDVVVHDVGKNRDARQRLIDLGSQHHVEQLGLPSLHTMDRLLVGYSHDRNSQERVESLLAIDVYTRVGCPRCQAAKLFVRDLAVEWPAIRFNILDIESSPADRDRLQQLAQHYRIQAASVPAFHVCRQLKIGFLGNATTGKEIASIIRRAARSLPPPKNSTNQSSASSPDASDSPLKTSLRSMLRVPASVLLAARSSTLSIFAAQATDPGGINDIGDDFDAFPEMDGSESAPIPNSPIVTNDQSTDMEVPYLGRLDAEHLGMPVFTFLVGLVDGFNPCAMWVLMFLLSVLVNIRERKKIIVIAGTFVLVSGLAYFAFMAAWLNVFMLVGLDRPAQVILGCIAIVIGLVNVKDFFAFGKGISFKIPEAAKPGIYSRVRKIVAAKSVWAALAGAIILAVLVNMVELLCTAGLPAMYTEILILQEYSPLVNYLYLGLYIVAYMLDDSILVAIVVITLSKQKLQEQHGRWLKLLSGVVILALGIVMIVKPNWLV